MVDVVNKSTRSTMMSGIRGKNTKPEIFIRSLLHRRGFRFRLHDKKLPGRPDIVLPKHKAVIEVRGCFWHGHDCHLFVWPSTRKDFWKEKIYKNRERDRINMTKLHNLSWKTLIVWECAIKGKEKLPARGLSENIESWILHDQLDAEIPVTDC